MPPLLHDRYLEISATHACDLATGDLVPATPLTPPDGRPAPLLATLVEVFAHGRDGLPRAVDAELPPALRWRTAVDRIATDAVAHGYVPIGARVYQRLRSVLDEHLDGRAIVLLASDGDQGAAALIDAASRSARAHVLVTLRNRRSAVSAVREARAAYSAASPRPRPVTWPADVQHHIDRGHRAAEFVRTGRHAAAERLLRDVAGALLRRCAWGPAILTLIGLGRVLLERGRTSDALRAFDDAAAAAVTGGEASLEVDARIWMATAKTDAEQLTAAESICRALLLVGAVSVSQRAWIQAVLARVLRHQGRRAEPIARLDAVPEEASGTLDAATLAFIRATVSRQHLDAGDLFAAGLALGARRAESEPTARLIEATAWLRLVAQAGDLQSCERLMDQIRADARVARSPLRHARARLIWAQTLARAGQTREAGVVFAALERMAPAAPALLRHAMARRSRHPIGAVSGIQLPPASASSLVRMALEEDDDRRAVELLIGRARQALDACRVDVWSMDAGPASVIVTCGTGLPSTIGERILDAGIAIGPDGATPAVQVGVPVRVGSRVIGALVARWPVDRVSPPDATPMLDLIAAVAAPRLDACLQAARREAHAATAVPALIGVSAAMADVRRAIARAAGAPFNVLIEGESGVGKELIARAVHQLSPRRERRFCDVNCAALPDDLLESELFGHAKGAFTGAVADRAGLFEEAHGGTLFLDEVADLTPRAQAKLLRVLQQQEVRRVGENFTRRIDVRLVAAANRDMREEAGQGRFRQDLLYRIDVVRITVPALRERPDDIAVLAQHFWAAAATRVGTRAVLTPAVIAALTAFQWPGNVRELQNVLAALAVAAPARGSVMPSLLPAAISGAQPIRSACLADARVQFERRFVSAALARASGNRARAARALGLSRQGLLKLLERLQVEK